MRWGVAVMLAIGVVGCASNDPTVSDLAPGSVVVIVPNNHQNSVLLSTQDNVGSVGFVSAGSRVVVIEDWQNALNKDMRQVKVRVEDGPLAGTIALVGRKELRPQPGH